jgi:hypothetical protein
MPAGVLAPARRVGASHDAARPVWQLQRRVAMQRRQPFAIGTNEREPRDGLALLRGALPVRQREEIALGLRPKHVLDALLAQPFRVERCIEAVGAQACRRVHAARALDERRGEPSRGVHRQVERDE